MEKWDELDKYFAHSYLYDLKYKKSQFNLIFNVEYVYLKTREKEIEDMDLEEIIELGLRMIKNDNWSNKSEWSN